MNEQSCFSSWLVANTQLASIQTSPVGMFNIIADMLAILVEGAKGTGQISGTVHHLVVDGLSILQYVTPFSLRIKQETSSSFHALPLRIFRVLKFLWEWTFLFRRGHRLAFRYVKILIEPEETIPLLYFLPDHKSSYRHFYKPYCADITYSLMMKAYSRPHKTRKKTNQ